jgi:hypothetical protein
LYSIDISNILPVNSFLKSLRVIFVSDKILDENNSTERLDTSAIIKCAFRNYFKDVN